VRVAEFWVEDDFEASLRWVIGWHMDMIRLKMAEQSTRLLNPDLRDTLLRLSSSISRESLFRLLDSAVHLRDLSRTQANRQMMIEVFLCECAVRYGHDRLASRS
jgi:DNA polymerase-3 subunit delta'